MNAPQLVEKFIEEDNVNIFRHLAPDELEELKPLMVQLLLTTWKVACKAQNESTQAAATHAEKFHKPKTPRPIYTLGSCPPFSIETLPATGKID